MQGVIKKLNDKGFGFISLEGQPDLFFHAKDLRDVKFDELREGLEVSFEIVKSDRDDKKTKAADVSVLRGSNQAANDNADDDMDMAA